MALHHLFDIATRYNGNWALAVADEEPELKVRGTAYLFDLTANTLQRKFPVRYERPGYRLALARDDKVCFLGCYEAYGLGAYSTNDGTELWRRKDLKSVQSITASEVQDWVFCGRETGAGQLLRATTGETIEKLTGIKDVFVSPFDDSVAVAGRSLDLHRPFGTKLGTVKRSGKDEIHCAFSPSELVSSDGENFRGFDLATRELLWNFPTSPGKTHILLASFHRESGCFAAVTKDQRALWFEARTGRIIRQANLAAPLGLCFGFFRNGTRLLGANLCVQSSETGMQLADLATPELLAWDPQARMERFRELAASDRSLYELERYMVSEGFAKNDITRVLMMKWSHDRGKAKS